MFKTCPRVLRALCHHHTHQLSRGRALATAAEQVSTPGLAQDSHSRPHSSYPQTDKHNHPVPKRWLELVDRRALEFDEDQWHIIQRLAKLYDAIAVYAQQLAVYRAHMAAHRSRFDARLAELQAAHAASKSVEKQQQSAPVSSTGSPASSREGAEQGGGTLASLLGSVLPEWMLPTGVKGSKAKQLTPMQKEQLQRAQFRDQVTKELGPAPTAPDPPRGLYLYGSVGSGKTLLMDIFYSALAQDSQLLGITKHRRIHFNAAMLELHQHMHHHDVQQRQAAHTHHHQQQSDGTPASTGSSSDAGELLSEGDEELHESGRMRRGFGMTHNEEVAQQQKTSKKAIMAIRKYLSLSRMGRISPEALAAANSRCVSQAAAKLLGSNDDLGKLEAKVLAFDEMQVSDVFSAVALKGIVEWNTSSGGILVLTSNRAPTELPRHGLHEGMFSHFIEALEHSCDVVPLTSAKDYRVQMLQQGSQAHASDQTIVAGGGGGAVSGVYVSPLTDKAQHHVQRLWDTVTQSALPRPEVVPVLFGRHVNVSKAAKGAAHFDFAELCAAFTGPADFTALAQHYHTLFIHGVPPMSMQIRDQARRFITLVDELYNNKVLLVLSSEVPPEQLFTSAANSEPILDLEQLQFEGAVEGSKLRTDLSREGGVTSVASTPTAVREAKDLLGGREEQFAFARALSRLYEMQSQAYIANWRETTWRNWQKRQAAGV